MSGLLIFAALWVVIWCVTLIFMGGTDEDDDDKAGFR